MFEDYIYENYEIDFSEDCPVNEESYFFIFNHKRQLYLNSEGSIPLVNSTSSINFDFNFNLFIGRYKNRPVYVADVDEVDNFHDMFQVYERNQKLYQIATRALLIRDWYKSHRYCGQCGTKTEIDKKDMMLICPNCGQMHYPRIAPAIIVTITKNNKLLMAKHSYHKIDRYALIAGFVEPGETIEEAVHREVREEIGIKIKNLKYLKSQSWPFPNSLMLGFTAEYDSGEIRVDKEEILEAKWFTKTEIEPLDSDISISSWLINHFKQNN